MESEMAEWLRRLLLDQNVPSSIPSSNLLSSCHRGGLSHIQIYFHRLSSRLSDATLNWSPESIAKVMTTCKTKYFPFPCTWHKSTIWRKYQSSRGTYLASWTGTIRTSKGSVLKSHLKDRHDAQSRKSVNSPSMTFWYRIWTYNILVTSPTLYWPSWWSSLSRTQINNH